MKKTAYVIGSKVSKSLSPTIFKYWFEQNNIDAEYKCLEIEEGSFDLCIDRLLENNNVCGFNVTMPFKESVKGKLNSLNSHAEKIGAVNCVTREKNKWVGKNTDWIGFIQAIKEKNSFKKKDLAIVVGCGGAAKAVIYGLKKEGFKEIKVFNRSKEKIIDIGGIKTPNILGLEHVYQDIERADLVVNTVPINTLNQKKELFNLERVVAFDAVYKPKETPFLLNFRKDKRVYGISMLVNQAVPCFEEWFGKKPTIDRGLIDLLEEKIKE